MSGNLFWGFLISSLFLISCARPEYLESKPASPAGTVTSEKAVTSLPLSQMQVSIVWKKAQTEEETGSFLLKFWRPNLADQSQVLLDFPQALSVHLWMPSMGHGSSPVTITRLDVGTYLIEEVYFSMPGVWEIQIQLKDENGAIDATAIPVHY
jgi:hypothetical protein